MCIKASWSKNRKILSPSSKSVMAENHVLRKNCWVSSELAATTPDALSVADLITKESAFLYPFMSLPASYTEKLLARLPISYPKARLRIYGCPSSHVLPDLGCRASLRPSLFRPPWCSEPEGLSGLRPPAFFLLLLLDSSYNIQWT